MFPVPMTAHEKFAIVATRQLFRAANNIASSTDDLVTPRKMINCELIKASGYANDDILAIFSAKRNLEICPMVRLILIGYPICVRCDCQILLIRFELFIKSYYKVVTPRYT